MTTPITPLRKDHTLTGAIVPLPYDWKIDAATELLVTLVDTVSVPNVETTLTNGADYSVSGVSNPAGGNVTPTLAYTSGWKIVITNRLSYEQTAAFTNQNSVKPTEVEGALDRLSKQIKQIVETLSRTVQTTIGGGISPSDLLTTLLAYVTQAGASATTATTQAGIATTQAGVAQGWATTAQNAATGINWTKARVASIGANINIASPGATIDSIAMVAGDRVLLKNQTLPAQNGIYIWNGAAVAMTRSADMDTWPEVVSKVVQIEEGTSTYIDGTKSNADVPFTATVNTGGTIGVTAITFTIFAPPIQDNSVTATKIANGIITYAKMLASEFATTAQILSGALSKLVNAENLAPLFYKTQTTKAAPQAIATTTNTALTWDTETFDDGGWHDNATNPTRHTVNYTGRVRITSNAYFGLIGSAQVRFMIYKNGAMVREAVWTNTVGGAELGMTISEVLACTSGDYFELFVWQNSGAGINTVAANTSMTSERA